MSEAYRQEHIAFAVVLMLQTDDNTMHLTYSYGIMPYPVLYS